MRVLLPILLLAGCVAPTSGSLGIGPFESEADYRQQREAATESLDAAITPATASSATACRVVPTSEQACGGPTTFAIYSRESPNATEIEWLAARLVALDTAANRQFEYISTCAAYTPPTPVLRDGVCVSSRE
ncbi:MAG: hypothetical protein AAF791_15725 [Bacteroidota bacterium]